MLMVALLVLAASEASAGGVRTFLFVLLVIAIVLIVVGAVIAMITMYFYWKARLNKASKSAGTDATPGL